MKENEEKDYCTRMSLINDRGWTKKMTEVLLKDAKYKSWGNYYGGGLIKLYKLKDIEDIENTKEYKELRTKVDKRRKKVAENKRIQEEKKIEKQRLEKEKKLKDLAKFYEQDTYLFIKSSEENEQPKVQWQKNCLQEIESKSNIILASPTSSGKTRVFLEWALKKKERPIFITAPIKAVSNQRYRELRKLGYIVGIETGDIKNVPNNSEFICCTQEIYTNKYMNKENATLIIDEFHYIFENQDRTRAYIDALKNSKAENILICSATLGNLNKFKNYIDKVSNKSFYLYENTDTLTELFYKNEIDMNLIKNALVIAFSQIRCKNVANTLVNIRKEIEQVSIKFETKNQENFARIKELAIMYNVQIDKLQNKDYIRMGVAVYYGSLLPKEKFFIEKIFEERLIDTIVGTDALALGVNFPVQNVVFVQLFKDYEGAISKNLFQQLSGRAGRKGYFDIGYVYYLDCFYEEDAFYNIGRLYKNLLSKENENIKIILMPIISNILKGITTVQEESRYIVENSTEIIDIKEITDYINNAIKYINSYTYKIADNKKDEFRQNIANVYFDEYSVQLNCSLFRDILENKTIQQIIDYNYNEFNNFNSLLHLRRYLLHLPKKYNRKLYIESIEKIINDIDNTALNID